MTNQGRNAVDTLLAEALKELSETRPIEKITIKEITDRAGVIRPTFYNHFQDKYELLEWIIMSELVEPMKPLLKNGMTGQALVLLFTSIKRDKAFYTRASRLEGQNSFESIAKDCVKKTLLEIFEEEGIGNCSLKYGWLTPELVAEYYAQSMNFVAIKWIRSGMGTEPEELAEIYGYIMKHSLDDVLEDIRKENNK